MSRGRLRLSSSRLSDKGKRLKHDEKKKKKTRQKKYDNILKSYSLFLVLVAAPPSPPSFFLHFRFPLFHSPTENGNAGGAWTIKSVFYEPKEHPFSSLSPPPPLLSYTRCAIYAALSTRRRNYFLPRFYRPSRFCSVRTTSDRILMTFHISKSVLRARRVQRFHRGWWGLGGELFVKLFRLTVASERSKPGAVAPGDKTFRLIYCRFGN